MYLWFNFTFIFRTSHRTHGESVLPKEGPNVLLSLTGTGQYVTGKVKQSVGLTSIMTGYHLYFLDNLVQ